VRQLLHLVCGQRLRYGSAARCYVQLLRAHITCMFCTGTHTWSAGKVLAECDWATRFGVTVQQQAKDAKGLRGTVW